MERESGAAVELRGIEFAYEKEQPVLHGIDLRVGRGEWVAIVGESGCGKSTLVRLLNALLTPQEGQVFVFGEELTAHNAPQVRSRIGMVFQNPDNQFIGESVEEDIAFGLEGLCLKREEMERRIAAYAHLLNIAPLLHKHPGELSGGQKQRCAVASCLAMEPEIVVFDESTSMQDERSRRELLSVMNDMRQQGAYTVFSVTHDADEMLAADRIIALRGGGIRGDLPPAEFFADEELLQDCGIELPFRLKLARELAALGIGHTNEAGTGRESTVAKKEATDRQIETAAAEGGSGHERHKPYGQF